MVVVVILPLGSSHFPVPSYPPPLKYKIAVFLCGYICYKMNLQVQNRLKHNQQLLKPRKKKDRILFSGYFNIFVCTKLRLSLLNKFMKTTNTSTQIVFGETITTHYNLVNKDAR